jgi:hypothetical protein
MTLRCPIVGRESGQNRAQHVALTVPAGHIRPGKPRAKSQLKLSRPRIATSPRDYAKNGGGLWPQCGAGPAIRPLMRAGPQPPLVPRARGGNCFSTGLILGSKALTRPAPQDYIDPLGRAAAWRDGASAKPLTVSHGDRASGHALCGHVRRRVGCDGLYVLRLRPEDVLRFFRRKSGRRSCKAPGCLKSESEERETWTAESLRAASSNGEGLGFFRKSSGHGRDFGGRRFR